MNARDAESDLLTRCTRIAAGVSDGIGDDREANVVRVAAMLARSRHPLAARRLQSAADEYFDRHPDARMAVGDVIRREWLIGLPRFRALLDARLGAA